ncbi:MAG: hypothetical protein WAN89_03975 [Lawsonella sp.]
MTTPQLTIPQLLDTLATRRIDLWVEDEALKFRAPNGAFTPELKQQVVTHKAAIIEALQRGTVVRDPDNAHQPFPLLRCRPPTWWGAPKHSSTGEWAATATPNSTSSTQPPHHSHQSS